MRSMREGLIKKENAKNILFHILIPAWAPVQITAPLHFPEDLYPLQNRGAERTGEAVCDAQSTQGTRWFTSRCQQRA